MSIVSRTVAALLFAALSGIGALAFAGAPALAESRTALVIGNGAYEAAPLANAVNDATDMAAALEATGFEVILRTDADQRAMDQAVEEFAAALKSRGGVGMFYYSGHGIQVDEQNYLLPIGGSISDAGSVKYGALNAGQVIDVMEGAGSELNIVVLDACRNNPLPSSSRSAARGLSRINTAASGLFVSFSTAPGEVALDGDGRNSPYTEHLVEAIGTPGLNLEGVFKEALKGVHNETGGGQVPWISSSFFGDFIFTLAGGGVVAGGGAPEAFGGQVASGDIGSRAGFGEAGGEPGGAEGGAGASASGGAEVASAATGGGAGFGGASAPSRQASFVAPKVSPEAVGRGVSGIYSAEGVNPNGTTYRGMVRIAGENGNGDFKVDWWIVKTRYSGNGRRDGRWLRVDWGQTAPVIYTQGADGALDGIWADGKASEYLTPHALGRAGDYAGLAGTYAAAGTNPNGSAYKGSVTIEPEGPRWRVRWTVGTSYYEGVGELDGSILTVDWGDASPVVYAVRDDGSLAGLWASGLGSETLTPAL